MLKIIWNERKNSKRWEKQLEMEMVLGFGFSHLICNTFINDRFCTLQIINVLKRNVQSQHTKHFCNWCLIFMNFNWFRFWFAYLLIGILLDFRQLIGFHWNNAILISFRQIIMYRIWAISMISSALILDIKKKTNEERHKHPINKRNIQITNRRTT